MGGKGRGGEGSCGRGWDQGPILGWVEIKVCEKGSWDRNRSQFMVHGIEIDLSSWFRYLVAVGVSSRLIPF